MLKYSLLYIILLFTFLSAELSAQEVGIDEKKGLNQDTNYVISFPDYLNGRVYLSRKFTNLAISKRNNSEKLKYRPNTTINFGVGATYKGVTLNLGYGFSALNEDEGKGETEYLDLQSHIYRSDKVIDIFGQFYEGLYLRNTKDYAPEFPANFYLRPDINIKLIGLNARKVLNGERFSYSAPFVQNQMQKKSAGSFLVGFKAIALFTTADSSFLPYISIPEIYGNTLKKKRS